jgi:transposase
MGQVEVITGVERRRRWSDDQKRAIVAAAFTPGAVVTEVARRVDVCASLIYRWRRELRTAANGFAEVVVMAGNAGAAAPTIAAIEIGFHGSAHVRIPLSTPPALAAAVVKALAER